MVKTAPGSAAEKAGMMANDVIAECNGSPLAGPADRGFIKGRVDSSEGKPVHFKLKRGDTLVEIEVTPEKKKLRWVIGLEMNTGCP